MPSDINQNHNEEEDKSVTTPITQNPNKPERPPLLKKPKKITEEDNPGNTFSSTNTTPITTTTPTPHFPGPLFPAVRRIDLRVSVNDDTSTNPSASPFSDRDWVYPSFLGAIPVKNRPTLKAFGSEKREVTSLTSVSGRSLDKVVDETRRIARSPELEARKPGEREGVKDTEKEKEKEKQKEVKLGLSSTNHSDSRRTPVYKHSLLLYLLAFICMVILPYVIHLRRVVARLQNENYYLCKLCSDKLLGSEDYCPSSDRDGDIVSASYWIYANSRTLALCTVVVIVATPFLLYRYLSYLPYLKNLSKGMKSNKEEVPLKKRIAYLVDVCFSVYPYAKLLALLFATIFLIAFGGLALYAVSDGSFTEALWLSWTFVADSGNHADRVGMGPRIVSVSISSGGMLIFAMMLGLVSDAISEKMDSLRKGKSEVIESNHILILGWSDKLGSLLKQLAIANKSIGGGVIVVLAERDKEEMELDIGKLEFDFMGTSVICRSGSPLILADLKKVSVSKARAIIVLATDDNADQSDARALRVVLSLTGVKEGLRGHVVVELSDLDNEPLVKLVGGELIETVVAHDVIGRLMIQCALQPGLAQIWEDILGFENAEFYIKQWPQLVGMRFQDVLVSFPDAIPCGIKVAEDGGKIRLNPDDGYVLKEGDEVLVIAEDDDTYAPGPLPE